VGAHSEFDANCIVVLTLALTGDVEAAKEKFQSRTSGQMIAREPTWDGDAHELGCAIPRPSPVA
jgi:hypothetical protein